MNTSEPLLTDQDLRGQLAIRILNETQGNQQAFAKQHDISPAYVSDVLCGRRAPGAKILAALGYERVVGYRQIT